jgi:hypothetical protein
MFRVPPPQAVKRFRGCDQRNEKHQHLEERISHIRIAISAPKGGQFSSESFQGRTAIEDQTKPFGVDSVKLEERGDGVV